MRLVLCVRRLFRQRLTRSYGSFEAVKLGHTADLMDKGVLLPQEIDGKEEDVTSLDKGTMAAGDRMRMCGRGWNVCFRDDRVTRE